jgi:hypothetical protein
VQLLLHSMSPGTDSNYSPGLQSYIRFCSTHNAAFPPADDMVLAFATYLFSTLGQSLPAVKRQVIALRSACVETGSSLIPFEDLRLNRLYQGMARSAPFSATPRESTRRLPITGPLLARLVESVRPNTVEGRALRAGVAIGFFGLLRAGEFTYKDGYPVLCRRHVSWEPSHVAIHLEQSKTDRWRRGVSVKIFRSQGPVCAVSLLWEAWVTSPLQDHTAPLLQVDRVGSPLSYRALLDFIKTAVSSLGYAPAEFSTHSLRIGGATQLAMCQFSGEQIQAVGRWTSDCYQRYVRFPNDFFRQVALALGASTAPSDAPYGPLSLHRASASPPELEVVRQ